MPQCKLSAAGLQQQQDGSGSQGCRSQLAQSIWPTRHCVAKTQHPSAGPAPASPLLSSCAPPAYGKRPFTSSVARAVLQAMLAEFRLDYNQRHFVRNETFKKAAEGIEVRGPQLVLLA